MQHESPTMLDPRAVDRIHTRLAVRYGSKWLNLYAGLEEALVKQDWARELAGLSLASIKHALEHLPDDAPPNVQQFRAACLKAPNVYVALPAPKGDAAVAAEALARMAQVGRGGGEALAWARRLQRRENEGDRLTIAQKTMWREALRTEAGGAIGEREAA